MNGQHGSTRLILELGENGEGVENQSQPDSASLPSSSGFYLILQCVGGLLAVVTTAPVVWYWPSNEMFLGRDLYISFTLSGTLQILLLVGLGTLGYLRVRRGLPSAVAWAQAVFVFSIAFGGWASLALGLGQSDAASYFLIDGPSVTWSALIITSIAAYTAAAFVASGRPVAEVSRRPEAVSLLVVGISLFAFLALGGFWQLPFLALEMQGGSGMEMGEFLVSGFTWVSGVVRLGLCAFLSWGIARANPRHSTLVRVLLILAASSAVGSWIVESILGMLIYPLAPGLAVLPMICSILVLVGILSPSTQRWLAGDYYSSSGRPPHSAKGEIVFRGPRQHGKNPRAKVVRESLPVLAYFSKRLSGASRLSLGKSGAETAPNRRSLLAHEKSVFGAGNMVYPLPHFSRMGFVGLALAIRKCCVALVSTSDPQPKESLLCAAQ